MIIVIVSPGPNTLPTSPPWGELCLCALWFEQEWANWARWASDSVRGHASKDSAAPTVLLFVDSKSRPGGAARARIQIFKTYTVSWRQEGHRFHPKGFLVMWRIRVPEPGTHPFGDFQIQICTECLPVSLLWQKDAESSIRFFLRHRTKALFFLFLLYPSLFLDSPIKTTLEWLKNFDPTWSNQYLFYEFLAQKTNQFYDLPG